MFCYSPHWGTDTAAISPLSKAVILTTRQSIPGKWQAWRCAIGLLTNYIRRNCSCYSSSYFISHSKAQFSSSLFIATKTNLRSNIRLSHTYTLVCWGNITLTLIYSWSARKPKNNSLSWSELSSVLSTKRMFLTMGHVSQPRTIQIMTHHVSSHHQLSCDSTSHHSNISTQRCPEVNKL